MLKRIPAFFLVTCRLSRPVSQVVLILSLLISSPLFSIMVIPLSIKQMTGQSEKIILGVCEDVFEELDENQIPATYIRLQVRQGLKGVKTGEKILFKVFGKQDETPLSVKEGERALVHTRKTLILTTLPKKEDTILVFLYPESPLGFTSPVGAGQGLFFINPQSSENIPNNEKSLRLTLVNESSFSLMNRTKPESLDTLLDEIRSYVGPTP